MFDKRRMQLLIYFSKPSNRLRHFVNFMCENTI